MSQPDATPPIRVEVAPPATHPSTTSELVSTVGQFVGAIAGVAGVIYLFGTLVLLARLWWTTGMSGVSQVAQLSRDVLLSLGLEVVIVPIAIGVFYAIFRAIGRKPELGPPVSEVDPQAPWRRVSRPAVLAVVVLVSVPAVGGWVLDAVGGPVDLAWEWEALIGLGIFAVAVALAVMTVRGWERLGDGYVADARREARTHDGQEMERLARAKWNSMGAVTVVSLLFAAANVPSWAFLASSVPLGNAKVCPDSGRAMSGYLVGEGGSRTYLASYPQQRIESFPNDHVVRVLVGPDKEQLGDCPAPPAADKPAAPNIHVRVPRAPAPVIRVRVSGADDPH